MNVLYLTMNPNRASTTVPTEGWIRLLKDQGLEPVLVSHEVGAFHEWAVERGIPAYHVEMPAPDKWRPWRFLKSLWQLRAIAKRHKVQLIHCNEQNIYPNGQFLGRLMRLPVVVSIHFTMGRSYCEWAFGGNRAPTRIFFISPGNLDACRPSVEGVIPKDRWRMLYNGLDLAHFTPSNERRSRFRAQFGLDGKLALGVACALRERKQLEHLFELGSRISDPRLRIVVAGGPVASEREYAAELLAQARKRLGERLVHVGHLDELRDFYNGLDLFINTSREEACSISVLESMACGCPVVGYPSKSVDGQVLPGGGEIVPQDDLDALAGVVDRWVNDYSFIERGRLGARARVEDAFDIRKLSIQLWDEYMAVVAGSVA
ncbi:glycosyltransferase family 4 protein [Anatilimnocola sp. NA78]|uniref:glycosyltransferase family 4 protein n=1 Tax=Anatilimnocola sp. NA78 TaxID=3415683 RepID=UPI003CE4ED5E